MQAEAHEHSLADIGEKLIARMRHDAQFPLITVEGTSVVIYDRRPDGTCMERYYIPQIDLFEAKGVSFWVRQLAPKNWITTRHLELLASTIYALNGGAD